MDYSHSSPDDIFITDGASQAIRNVLRLLIRGPQDGVLIPVPQYPLYFASSIKSLVTFTIFLVSLYGGTHVPYFLNEEESWKLDINEVKRAVNEAKGNGKLL